MNIKLSCGFWLYLSVAMLCPPLAIAQTKLNSNFYKISGRVVDETGKGVSQITVTVQRGSANIATTRTDASGGYSVSFNKGEMLAVVVYGNLEYMPNSVLNLSGESNHSITKVVSRLQQGQQISLTRAAEVITALDVLQQRPSLYG